MHGMGRGGRDRESVFDSSNNLLFKKRKAITTLRYFIHFLEQSNFSNIFPIPHGKALSYYNSDIHENDKDNG